MNQETDLTSTNRLKEEIERLKEELTHEQESRRSTEALLNKRSLELYESNQRLHELNDDLERNILKRTKTLTSLIQSLHEGVLLEDEDRKIMLVNTRFCDFFEISAEPSELVGADCSSIAKKAKNLFPNPEEFEKDINQLVSKKEKEVGEVLRMANGRVLVRDFLPIYIGEDYVGHLWKYRDITDSFKIEKKIKASEEKYRGIIENMELGLLEVDKNHNVIKAYDWFCDMTGYSREELEGQNVFDLLLPEKYKTMMLAQDKKREEGKQSIYEVELKRKDGEIIWVLISGAPFYDEKGNMIGSIGIHYDITHRKKLEDELRSARKIAEDAMKAEKEFLANMSHEIRNPINAITGLINLLYDTHLNSEQMKYLDNIKYSSDILIGIISDVLDIAKIESGKMEIRERNFQVSESAKAIVQTYKFKSNKNVSFELDIDPKLDFEVMGDPTILNQILLNLISNSVKFTKDGKIITKLELIEDLGDSVNVGFSVRDTGIGIDQNQIGLIFESFKQGNKQIKLRYGGTGLGLSIVKRLVDIYGGDISVSSEPGKGSEFTFNMIYKKSTESKVYTDSKNANKSIHDQINHVLVVEDNHMNQQYLIGLLEKWEITYDIANHGAEAMELIGSNTYDLVLMDIRMPIMDGYETTIRIRNSDKNPNKDVPIIALTASALVDEKEKTLAAGMNHHLTKPFSPEQLLAVFEQLHSEENENGQNMENPEEFKFSQSLDSDYLESFYMDDIDRASLMFDIFLNNIGKELEEMTNHYKENNWEKLRQLAHRIKPNFVMVGLQNLTDHMAEIELAAKSEKNAILEKIVPEFFQKFNIKRQIVEDELTRMKNWLQK